MHDDRERSDDLAGTLLGGRYRILEKLGEGTIGEVYLAQHTRFGRHDVVRVFADSIARDEETIERIRRGILLATAIRHPNVATIVDFGVYEGRHFVVTKYVPGVRLSELLGQDGPLPVRRAVRIAVQVANALQAAHDAGVIHRDLKPASIMVSSARDGSDFVQLVGLELALASEATNDITRQDIDTRSFAYRSPEQLIGESIDARSDVYSLGVVLFEMLTGALPFEAATPAHLLAAYVAGVPRRLSDVHPDTFSDSIQRILDRSLQPRPKRYATAAEFARDLASVMTETSHTDAPAYRSVASAAPSRPDAAAAKSDEAGFTELFQAGTTVSKRNASGTSPVATHDVRFKVYRPRAVLPERWTRLVVFAYADDSPAARRAGRPSAAERVGREAKDLLGRDLASYTTMTEDSAAPVARESQLLFIPRIDGFRFNPPHIAVAWLDDVEHVVFKIKADRSLDGTTARGSLQILSGVLLLAEMSLVIRVGADEAAEAVGEAAAYRKIFASYSRHDESVVRRMETYAKTLGDEVLRDVHAIRAGEKWSERLLELIEEADVFQLFWSRNALASKEVEREWKHALALGRPNFVRPFYWESPFPEDKTRELPPKALRDLNFQRVQLGDLVTDEAPRTVSSPSLASPPGDYLDGLQGASRPRGVEPPAPQSRPVPPKPEKQRIPPAGSVAGGPADFTRIIDPGLDPVASRPTPASAVETSAIPVGREKARSRGRRAAFAIAIVVVLVMVLILAMV